MKNEKDNKKKEQIKVERAAFKKQLKLLYDSNPNIIDAYSDLLRGKDECVHVYCNLSDDGDIFDKYSYRRFVNNDFYDFIEKTTYYLRPAVPLIIEADVPLDFSKKDEESFRKDFIFHYNMNFENKKKSIRRNNIIATIMAIIGVILLALYVLFASIVKDNVIIELLSILAWVFVWEATDRFFFHSTELKVECFNAGQLAIAKLVFNRGHEPR